VATLRSLTIQNFKAIGDPVKIEFKPITLLFGPNSAGKSTIIQALLYAREIFVNRNPDPHRIIVHGEQVDLGGFRAMVHNRDTLLPISMKIELELNGESLPEYIQDDEIRDQVWSIAERYLRCLAEVCRVSVEVTLFWDKKLSRPYVVSYSVSINDEQFALIFAPFRIFQESVRSRKLSDEPELADFLKTAHHHATVRLNLKHSLFYAPGDDEGRNLLTEFAELVLEDPADIDLRSDATKGLLHGAIMNTAADALLDWDTPVDFWSYTKNSEAIGSDEPFRLIQGFNELLSRALVGPGRLIRNTLRSLRYLGPLRAIPPRILEQSQLVEGSGVPPGINTWKSYLTWMSRHWKPLTNGWGQNDSRRDTISILNATGSSGQSSWQIWNLGKSTQVRSSMRSEKRPSESGCHSDKKTQNWN
jgi:hypothetical protein